MAPIMTTTMMMLLVRACGSEITFITSNEKTKKTKRETLAKEVEDGGKKEVG